MAVLAFRRFILHFSLLLPPVPPRPAVACQASRCKQGQQTGRSANGAPYNGASVASRPVTG